MIISMIACGISQQLWLWSHHYAQIKDPLMIPVTICNAHLIAAQPNSLRLLLDITNMNNYGFTVTSLSSQCNKILPHTNSHIFEACWPGFGEYLLVSELSWTSSFVLTMPKWKMGRNFGICSPFPTLIPNGCVWLVLWGCHALLLGYVMVCLTCDAMRFWHKPRFSKIAEFGENSSNNYAGRALHWQDGWSFASTKWVCDN